MDKRLDEILQQKRNRALGPVQEREQKRDDWLHRIDELFRRITEWLKPSVEKGLLRIELRTHPMEEATLGRYEANAMRITFYNEQFVELVPIALQISGANGRIDMNLGDRDVRFLGDPASSDWLVAESFPGLTGAGWISKRHLESLTGERAQLLPFSKEVFEELLADYVEKF